MSNSVHGEAQPPEPDRSPVSDPWHTRSASEVLTLLDASADGLTTAEANARLERHGPNVLSAQAPASVWSLLLAQFQSVVVLLLVAAAVVALAVGDLLEAAAIAAVLLVNTVIGFVVELRARRAMEALLRHQVPEAAAVRDGALRRIPADGLVPGDVIEVGEGEAVPADARLLEASGVRTTEAALTGESTPVDKSVEPVTDPDTPLAERAPMLYAGTAVAIGRARAVVVATGADTELGRIGRLLEDIEDEQTPLERRLDVLGRRLVWVTLGIAAVVVAVGVLQGTDFERMIETGLALAIAAVPEGLPAVATIALAIGLRRMARRQVMVRRLGAVEALGSTTVVCTDKTGTLTAGEMTVTSIVTPMAELAVTGSGYEDDGRIELDGGEAAPAEVPGLDALLSAAALTPRARFEPDGQLTGDPTDAALLVLARKGGREPDRMRDALPLVGEVPFSSETRLSASLHRDGGGTVAYVKGAPGPVLERCRSIAGTHGPSPLDDDLRTRLRERNQELAREGLRVIALAEAHDVPDPDTVPDTLTFLGLIGMMDPPAEGVESTIRELRAAGIRTVMITGDQAATAAAVAGSLGMAEADGEPLDGRALARMDDAELAEAVGSTAIFSRVSPDDKLRIVAALRARGEIVAMLGDGVNDAAALKRADVGVAMGMRGTDVAKETADLVLQDDRFPTIAAAVEEGRVIFDNIRKFVYYLFSCNVAELLVVMAGSVAGLPLPLLPLQILWLNLVTDTFPALALAVEPGETGVMKRAPRDPESAILSRRFVASLSIFALLITGSTLGAFVWALGTGPHERAVTVAFMTLALAQLFHLGNARSRRPVIRPSRMLANRWALGAVVLVLTLQLLAVYWPPLATVLRTTPLGLGDWTVVLGLSLVPAVVGQIWRGL